MGRPKSDGPKVVSFVVDGVKHEQAVAVPDIPAFATLGDALALVNHDESKLLTVISRGLVASMIGDLKKTLKSAFLAENDPNRAAIRKLANIIFTEWASKKFGRAITRKEVKAQNVELAKKAFGGAMREARKRFATETVDLEA